MNLSDKTVLITGGSTGIGLAIAERFLKAGSEVIICGRREDKLQKAKEDHPSLHTFVCDVGDEWDRIALFEWATEKFPKINVLITNAGIQLRTNLTATTTPWSELRQELSINLDGTMHLAILFIPHLQKVKDAHIVTVSSGLAFAPGACAPIYSATKAAIQSFTMSLRHQLSKSTSIKVIEIVPPAVQTDLGGPGLHTFGVPLDEFTDSIMKDIEKGQLEVGYGFSEKTRNASRQELDTIFKDLNSRM